jgi:O-antigen/teichoic acid export membrane protein
LRKMTLWGIASVLGTSVFLYLLFIIIGESYLPTYSRGIPIMPIVLAKFGLLPLFLHGQYILMLNSKTRSLPAISFLACCLNIGLNYIWVSRLGIVGAAWASLLSEVCSVIAVNLLAYRSAVVARPTRTIGGLPSPHV